MAYEGDALPVDALLHRLRDAREDWEHGPHDLNVLGRHLDVEGMTSRSRDSVRLLLKAGRGRDARVMRHVWLPYGDAARLGGIRWDRQFTDGDGAARDAVADVVSRGLAILGDGTLETPQASDGDRKLTAFLIRPETDAAVKALVKRQGVRRDDVIRALVNLGLSGIGPTRAGRSYAASGGAGKG